MKTIEEMVADIKNAKNKEKYRIRITHKNDHNKITDKYSLEHYDCQINEWYEVRMNKDMFSGADMPALFNSYERAIECLHYILCNDNKRLFLSLYFDDECLFKIRYCDKKHPGIPVWYDNYDDAIDAIHKNIAEEEAKRKYENEIITTYEYINF